MLKGMDENQSAGYENTISHARMLKNYILSDYSPQLYIYIHIVAPYGISVGRIAL